jgi:RNA polymerase sigma-70 factor (ECF subfamily)
LPGSDQQASAVIRLGEGQSFQQVFESYYVNLCKYAFTIIRDMDEAEDVVQSVFLKILEKRDSLSITNDIKSYLYRAVHNYCINRIAHTKTRKLYQEQSMVENSGGFQSPDVFSGELEERVAAAIEKLPPQCKKIFVMSRHLELKYSQIASELGISVNTIENQISKALRILREELKDSVNENKK